MANQAAHRQILAFYHFFFRLEHTRVRLPFHVRLIHNPGVEWLVAYFAAKAALVCWINL